MNWPKFICKGSRVFKTFSGKVGEYVYKCDRASIDTLDNSIKARLNVDKKYKVESIQDDEYLYAEKILPGVMVELDDRSWAYSECVYEDITDTMIGYAVEHYNRLEERFCPTKEESDENETRCLRGAGRSQHPQVCPRRNKRN